MRARRRSPHVRALRFQLPHGEPVQIGVLHAARGRHDGCLRAGLLLRDVRYRGQPVRRGVAVLHQLDLRHAELHLCGYLRHERGL